MLDPEFHVDDSNELSDFRKDAEHRFDSILTGGQSESESGWCLLIR